MKTNVLMTPGTAIANGKRQSLGRAIRAILGMLGMAIALHGAAWACRLDASPPSSARAMASYTYEAFRNVATPFSANAEVVAIPYFSGLPGFESAHMDAFLANGGATLYVVITGVSTNTLPMDTELGTVTVLDGEGVSHFVVRSDGLLVVVDEEI